MDKSSVSTRCECQATLTADLDASGCVISGAATWPRTGKQESAPAHRATAAGDSFDIAWQCPFCTRNALRSFRRPSVSAADEG